jgi:hypothetical protein
MPCTNDGLLQYLSRANYQAAIWSRALQPFIMAPDVTNQGWAVANNMVSIVWKNLPRAIHQTTGIHQNIITYVYVLLSSARLVSYHV